jgi:hypothetical protein
MGDRSSVEDKWLVASSVTTAVVSIPFLSADPASEEDLGVSLLASADVCMYAGLAVMVVE